MNPNLPDAVLGDAVAVSFARVVAAANVKARELGFEAGECIMNISQGGGDATWRVNYGSKYPGRRGGDLIIDVDSTNGTISRVLRGQ